ncbi:MAG: hypothetical protein R3185_09520, partial [Candidatus Thermoplasmatota archaeon]|nr:hypothetical protein [Candidatus Thermoplasmatota archaeon]
LAPTPASPTPWVDMGWGYLGPDETERATAMVLGHIELQERSVETTEAMTAYHEARTEVYERFMGDLLP